MMHTLKTTSLMFEGLVIAVCYKPSARYIRIHISPNLESNQPSIKLTCPMYATNEILLEFLHTHKGWISGVCDRFMHDREKSWQIMQAHCNEVLLFGEWVPMMPLAELQGHLYSYLLQRAAVFADAMGVRFSKFAVRTSRTRFGSCTRDRLSFSILLAFAIRAEIDYIVIHELAHIVHKNHSRQFWNLVAKHCPNWKALRKSLKSRYGLFIALLDRVESAHKTTKLT